jgi:hypothetical protein
MFSIRQNASKKLIPDGIATLKNNEPSGATLTPNPSFKNDEIGKY